jgi:hypothetical protein
MKDMGRVMAALKERYAGKVDFGKASAAVEEAAGGVGSQRAVSFTGPNLFPIRVHRRRRTNKAFAPFGSTGSSREKPRLVITSTHSGAVTTSIR